MSKIHIDYYSDALSSIVIYNNKSFTSTSFNLWSRYEIDQNDVISCNHNSTVHHSGTFYAFNHSP